MCIYSRILVLGLILVLQNLPIARILHPRNGDKTILNDLFSFGHDIVSSDSKVNSVIPLLELVVKCVPDLDIWNTIFALITKSRAIAPTVFNTAALDTRLKSTSGSQRHR
jgi:hypothetical protein